MDGGRLKPLKLQRESVTDIVYNAIREAIIERELAPGARVTEAALAAQLEVSKTPIREALLRLAHVGLIEPDGRRGGRVVVPSRAAIRAAYEVRVAIECETARLAAEQPDADSVSTLRDLAQSSIARAEANDVEGFRDLDKRFHLHLADLTQNSRLIALIRDAIDLTWILRRRDAPVADASVTCAQQHVEITKAIESGEPDDAEAAMRNHLTNVQRLVLAAFIDPQATLTQRT